MENHNLSYYFMNIYCFAQTFFQQLFWMTAYMICRDVTTEN